MTYPVWDISSWPVVSQEARGLDPKDWVVDPDEVQTRGQAHWALYKPVKEASYRRYDDWAEKIAASLARLIGLPAARVELARGESDEGIISFNVTPDGWSLDSGDTLLSELDGYVSCATDTRQKNRIGHNLDNIRSVLEGCSGPPSHETSGWAAFDVFTGYLVFDAWIANTDRHAINWGVLTCESDGRKALAATFDHGSALASGTQDERLKATTPEDYAGRGYASRFEDGHRLTLVDLALSAVEMCGPQGSTWLRRLAVADRSDVAAAVADIDEMSEVRRTFLCTLLDENQRRLTT